MIKFLTSIGSLTDTSLKTLREILSQDKQYFNSESIKQALGYEGQQLGSTLSAISKQTIDEEPLIVPFGKKSMKVERKREGKIKTISMPVQVYKIHPELLKHKQKILEHINEILEVLNN